MRPPNETGGRKMKISVPFRGRALLGRAAQLARRPDSRLYESAKTAASLMALSDGKRRSWPLAVRRPLVIGAPQAGVICNCVAVILRKFDVRFQAVRGTRRNDRHAAQTRRTKTATREGRRSKNGGALHSGRASPISEISLLARGKQVAVTESVAMMQQGNTL